MADDNDLEPLNNPITQRYKSMCQISLIILNIALSSFYFGYNMVYLSQINADELTTNIFPKPDGFDVPLASGLLNGCIPAGGLIGALSSSIFLRLLSRRYFTFYFRKSLLVVNVFAFVVGSLIFIENFYVLVFLRLCQGFCVGFYSAIAPLIIKELSPVEISGTLGVFAQLNVAGGCFFGCFFEFILSAATGDKDGSQIWPFTFGFTLITLAVQTAVLLFVFPYETPRYLLLNNEEKEARKLIAVIYKEEFVDEVLEEKKKDIESSKKA